VSGPSPARPGGTAAARFGLLLLGLAGCPTSSDDDAASPPPDDDDASEPTPPLLPERVSVAVLVTLDGEPQEGVHVVQGGYFEPQFTDAEGRVTLAFDLWFPADHYVIASHPDARQAAGAVPDEAGDSADADGDGVPDWGPLLIDLARFDPSDNEDYVFRDPGNPDDRGGTDKCAHCHVSIDADWFASPHRSAASGPPLHDLYAGTVAAAADEGACAALGGAWQEGVGPGTGGAAAFRCYKGDGVLPALNPGCDALGACDGSPLATAYGACADCHAPGIDGALGGRDLLEASGIAYRYGVHCDVCHHVEAIDSEGESGVAGRLRLVRPSEPQGGPLGPFQPLTFGPWHDVPLPVMGSVQRDHFHAARFCSGCHEQRQAVLVPGELANPLRWPDGRLPIHTTYSEWEEGPMNPAAPCQSCHMPPAPDVLNGADLQRFHEAGAGLVGGWERPPGAVRRHAFFGPRQPEAGMLQLAAALEIEKETDPATAELLARVTTRNVGPGHAIPTGEPMRSLVLLVQADCDGTPLRPTGGDVVPDFGGVVAMQDGGGDWSLWPGAQVGQIVRIVRYSGDFHDYQGFGPFGDGSFDAAGKGMPILEYVGESTIVGLDGDVATFDAPLPEGDEAWLGEAATWPVDGDAARAVAGAPGFAFARVLADGDGRRMVPHFLAVDVVSDNRLLPQGEWTSEHRFDASEGAGGCVDPTVRAVLVHRAYPLPLARERGWALNDSVMVEAQR
jgi:hypothetical protein